jgi:hypothetical protein
LSHDCPLIFANDFDDLTPNQTPGSSTTGTTASVSSFSWSSFASSGLRGSLQNATINTGKFTGIVKVKTILSGMP